MCSAPRVHPTSVRYHDFLSSLQINLNDATDAVVMGTSVLRCHSTLT